METTAPATPPLTRAARRAAGLLGLPALLAGVLHLALSAPADLQGSAGDSAMSAQRISAADPLAPFPAVADGGAARATPVPARLECHVTSVAGTGGQGLCILRVTPRQDI
ncbi:hypothetical protein HHL28_13230 [Aerophototrophica crusticola]|uniref:Uncharacterized protein n=1 Tax=Aerophototrophica crusticola TaxID=1709002 RepID=A0A858R984_9PROT|nr:hypothetical protein HHL28_13230 [Rhodospirillaceae bacterium B3]